MASDAAFDAACPYPPDGAFDATDGGEADAAVTGADGGPDAGPVEDECLNEANTAKKAELLASQPSLLVRSKKVIKKAIMFPSVANPSVACGPVELEFKDLNDNGTVEAYEDWTLPAEQRAADLVTRMTAAEKMGLMAHATLPDSPTQADPGVSAPVEAMIGAGIRFGRTDANTAAPRWRAAWANDVQALCEASRLGIPFVLSSEPAHSSGNGRVKAQGFSRWPHELSLAASGDVASVEAFGRVVSQEYRAIGVRMALSPSADLLTDPRWPGGPFTFGEKTTAVAQRAAAYVKGMQGAKLGPDSVACVAKHFPGAGAAKNGADARLAKGKFLAYPGNNIDAHLEAFKLAFDAGVAGVMPGYAIPEAGDWTGLGGLVPGATIEQVGAPFHSKLLTGVLRGHYAFGGLVLAPWGAIEDAGLSPFGAPWGVESLSRAQRVAKAVGAGVDQFGGMNDTSALSTAKTAGLLSDAQIDAAATRALALMLQLGLFENPYVDDLQATANCNSDAALQASSKAMNAGLVLLVNAPKPAGWLNGTGDGTQAGDPNNAGNGTGKVLPAPPGTPYPMAGTNFYAMGNFDLDYLRSVAAGYGTLVNDATSLWDTSQGKSIPVTTDAERIARSDYVLVRINAPFKADPDSGSLGLAGSTLEYATSDNSSELALLATARAAIDAMPGSRCQIIVWVDGGRPAVVSEILSYGVSGLYFGWGITDKAALDVAFGIANGTGRLPVGLALSNDAAGQQREDLPGDGQHATFVEGAGLGTRSFH